MRIVDVCAFYSDRGGGVKTYVRHKMLAGPKEHHEIIILAPAAEAGVEIINDHARIEFVRARRFPLDGRYHYFHDEPALHAKLDALRPDLVEASTPWASASMVANWRGSAPRSLIMHADPLGNYAYRWFRALAPRPVIDRSHSQRLCQTDRTGNCRRRSGAGQRATRCGRQSPCSPDRAHHRPGCLRQCPRQCGCPCPWQRVRNILHDRGGSARQRHSHVLAR